MACGVYSARHRVTRYDVRTACVVRRHRIDFALHPTTTHADHSVPGLLRPQHRVRAPYGRLHRRTHPRGTRRPPVRPARRHTPLVAGAKPLRGTLDFGRAQLLARGDVLQFGGKRFPIAVPLAVDVVGKPSCRGFGGERLLPVQWS